ncbi:hypothetical protein, partial [Campylobacter concisus]|uniref:hypothetical protein n=1 Tax=Campylobacter concisus TaxID=199 RepID=UPI0015E18765
AKPSTPISYLAQTSEKWLESSKEMSVKDAISIFGETAKWDSYLSVRSKILSEFEKFNIDNTAFLYRLLELCEMSKKVCEDEKNTMWNLKQSYSSTRYMQGGGEMNELLLMLINVIENKQNERKMAICEYIYKRLSHIQIRRCRRPPTS